MAQSFSVKAVLQAVDESFSSTMSKAMQMMKKLQTTTDSGSDSMNKKSNSVSNTFKSMAGAIGTVQIASKAFDTVKNSLDGAISRFDTLNKYPVVMKALGYSARDVSKSTKLLSNGIDGLPTSLDEITSNAQQLAPLVGSSQKAAKSALALNNAFLASGASVGDASRGLTQYTQMLSTGKVDMMSWRTLMETMPIALRKVANSFGFTGKSAETDLYDALQKGKITVGQLNDRFIKLNGGVNGFASLAKKNSAGIATSLANLKNSVVKNLATMVTAIDKGFAKAGFGSIAQQLDSLKYAINGAFTAIGPVATKAASTILKTLSSIFNFVKQNKDWLGPLAASIVTFIGAFKGTQAAVSGITSLITGLQKMQTFARSVAAAKNSIKAFFTLLGLNPWIVLIAGIAAVVAGLVWFFTQTKTGQKAWQAFTQFLSNTWQKLVSIAQNVWSAIANTFTTAVDKVKSGWNGITSFFSSLWQGIVSVTQSVWNSIVNVFTTAWNGFIQAVSPIIDAFKNLWNSLTEFFMVLWQRIVSITQTIWNGLSTFFSSLWQGIVAVATPIWSGLVTVITTMWNAIKTVVQTGINVVSTVIQTTMTVLQTIWSTIWNTIVIVAQTVWSVITAAVQTGITMISSIIQATLMIIQIVWSTIWNTIVIVAQTVWNMVVTVISTAINVVASIIQAITQAIQGNWEAVWNTIVSITTAVWNGITSVVSAGINGVRSVITAVMNGLGSVVSTVWNTIKNVFNAGVNFIKSVVHIDLSTQGRAIMNSFLEGLQSVWETVKSFVGKIGSWIKKHKGPISYDRKLLIPAGIAIMTGFNKGLQGQFEAVKKNVSNMAGAVSDAVSSNLGTITVPSPDARNFMATMSALQSARQNLYRQHLVSFGGTFSDNLTIDSPTMAQENNSLLRKIADKQQDIYLDGDVLVGSTYDRYDNRLGNRVNLKGRWS
jgi:tape measure domain-containing protein|nr:MAG TPA: tail tape measure [Caudoviricetes sp.]